MSEPAQVYDLHPAILAHVDPRLPGIWDQIRGYVDKALNRAECRDWNVDDVLRMALNGHVELWALVTGEKIFGAAVTHMAVFPRRTVMEVLAVGTDSHTEDDWLPCLDQLLAVARSRGCAALAGAGRKGWPRKLKASRSKTVWEISINV